MEVTELTAIVGMGMSILCVIGGVIARDRFLSQRIDTGDRSVAEELNKRVDNCHERINRTRDEFVRRDDLDGHLSRIERTIGSMHDEMKGTNKRIDDFITAVANDKRSNT